MGVLLRAVRGRDLPNSGRNPGVNRFLLDDTALAFAFGTRIADHAPRALARRTCTRNAEKSLLVADLTTPAAGAAADRRFPLRTSGASTGIAILLLAESHFLFGAEGCFFEFDSDVFAEVRASLGPSTTPGAASEDVAETEELPENVAEVLNYTGVETSACSASTHTGVTEAVIHSALLGISENRIRFSGFLKLFFGVWIIRIAVRVELQGELAICAFDLLIAGSALHSQHVVVVAFYVARQNSLS